MSRIYSTISYFLHLPPGGVRYEPNLDAVPWYDRAGEDRSKTSPCLWTISWIPEIGMQGAWNNSNNREENHDDVIKWKHFPRNWPFVRGILRSPVNSSHKASDAELWCFLWSARNKRLSKQWWGWWFETLSCSLWRHRNDMDVHKCYFLIIYASSPNRGQLDQHRDFSESN